MRPRRAGSVIASGQVVSTRTRGFRARSRRHRRMRSNAATRENAAGMASENSTDQTVGPEANRQNWKASPGMANQRFPVGLGTMVTRGPMTQGLGELAALKSISL